MILPQSFDNIEIENILKNFLCSNDSLRISKNTHLILKVFK